MILRLHRAVFGEFEGYHAVLGASLENRALLDALRDRTDRPPHHLAGTVWQPFERGLIIQGWYALCRTFPDPKASRGGLVKSFVVLAPVAEVAKANNFAALLSQLPNQYELPWPCVASEIEVDSDGLPSISPGQVPGLAKLVHELIHRADERTPVAWVGQTGSREVITALWNALWPSLRRNLQFDLRFAAVDLNQLKLTVVVIPEKAAGVWPATSPLVRFDDLPPQRTPEESALLGDSSGEPIHTLFRELGTEPVDFRALKIAALCVTCRQTLPQASPGEVYGYLGLLAMLAPQASQGVTLKEEALRRWATVGSQFGAGDVLALRNFPAPAFPSGEKMAGNLVCRWLRVHLPLSSSADDTAGVLLQALKSEAYCQGWNELVCHEAARLLEEVGSTMVAVLWKWWQRDWRLGKFCASYLSEDDAVENALVAARPSTLPAELARSVRALAAARGWGNLHAAVCAVSLPPASAFGAQLALPRPGGLVAGLWLLGAHFPPQDSLEAALASGDERLVQMAGEICAQHLNLLTALDWREEVGRRIFTIALDKDFQLWQRLSERREILHGLLDLLIGGEWEGNSLLEHLSATEEANLLYYPRRAKIWSRLPTSAKNGFLRVTADRWVATFRADPQPVVVPEEPLEEAILRQPSLDRLLAVASVNDFSVGLRAFEAFQRLDEPTLQDWIRMLAHTHTQGEFDRLQVGKLGALVLHRRWLATAQTLRQAAGSRRDLTPALLECLPLFSLLERLAIRFSLHGKSQIDARDFWDALEAELVMLYPHGPNQEHLWSRAGGDMSRLDQHGSGRQQWRAALRLIARGSDKHCTAHKLAAEAHRDFLHNERLLLLENCARRLDV